MPKNFLLTPPTIKFYVQHVAETGCIRSALYLCMKIGNSDYIISIFVTWSNILYSACVLFAIRHAEAGF